MKRGESFVIVLVCLLLVMSALCACGVSSSMPGSESDALNGSIEEREMPIYYNEAANKDVITLAFLDGVYDIPYVSLDVWKDLMIRIHREGFRDENRKDPKYDLTLTTEGDKAIYTRENHYTLTFDFEKNEMDFLDYDAFLEDSDTDGLVGLNVYNGKDKDGSPKYIKNHNGHSRYGKEVVLRLSDYGIDLVRAGDRYYAPLQTLSDFLISRDYDNAMYNGECVIIKLTGGTGFKDEEDKLTDLGEIYFSVGTGKRSDALIEYSYNELCLVLDSQYGLKAAHGIDSFDNLFIKTGLKDRLLDPDPVVADKAIFSLVYQYLDDLHSSFTGVSYLTGENAPWNTMENVFDKAGPSWSNMVDSVTRYQMARAEAFPDGVPGYEEIGDTAYITFDSFVMMKDNEVDYYKDAEPSADADDTFGLLIYAREQIRRKGSPVKNVVLDLSCNTGGEASAAVYTLGLFLGEASISIENTFSEALMTSSFKADTNLDGKFNKKDALYGKGLKLYCLISPCSFSCGNLVPSVFKQSDKVTLIGKTSGGGACIVQPMVTAWGTEFNFSGFSRLSFTKNGAFYDIDQGAEPDYTISHPEDFYDRKALTRFIDEIY